MAVTGQKDFGLAHSEKRLWVFVLVLRVSIAIRFSFHVVDIKILWFFSFFFFFFHQLRSEYRQIDGGQDIRGSVDFGELEVHEIRPGRIVESAGNIYKYTYYCIYIGQYIIIYMT